MARSSQLARWGGRRLSKRVGRALPLIGAAVAIFGFAAAVRKKGVLGGTFDTGLNAVPLVGTLKSAAELIWGRDLIPDRSVAERRVL
ncbi:MAG TPA: hypothetical protein VL225_04890 [Vicinamibacterales bacterium]|jgi:hypothetical protein|nr:hypothetical protein [Vicinamibacterales bacterium]